MNNTIVEQSKEECTSGEVLRYTLTLEPCSATDFSAEDVKTSTRGLIVEPDVTAWALLLPFEVENVCNYDVIIGHKSFGAWHCGGYFHRLNASAIAAVTKDLCLIGMNTTTATMSEVQVFAASCQPKDTVDFMLHVSACEEHGVNETMVAAALNTVFDPADQIIVTATSSGTNCSYNLSLAHPSGNWQQCFSFANEGLPFQQFKDALMNYSASTTNIIQDLEITHSPIVLTPSSPFAPTPFDPVYPHPVTTTCFNMLFIIPMVVGVLVVAVLVWLCVPGSIGYKAMRKCCRKYKGNCCSFRKRAEGRGVELKTMQKMGSVSSLPSVSSVRDGV